MENNPRNWKELSQVWKRAMASDAYIRASGGVPNSDIPLPEPGLIDVSGSIGGVGSKVMAGKLASLGNKSRRTANAWTRTPNPALAGIERAIKAKDAQIIAAQTQGRVGNAIGMSAFTAPDLYEMAK